MPQPTKEQFDAAAKKVMETAPAGLSRDDFFALIDKELAGPQGTPAYRGSTQIISDDMHEPGGPEPDSWIGGFLHSIGDQAKEALTGPSTLKALGRAAHPGAEPGSGTLETIGDFIGLMLPQTMGRSADLGNEMLRSGAASAKGAEPGLLNTVRGFWRGVWDDMKGVPTSEAREGVGINPPPKPIPATAAPMQPGRDLYQTYKEVASPHPPVQTKAPTKLPAKPPAQKMSIGGDAIDPNDPLYNKLMESIQTSQAVGSKVPPANEDALYNELMGKFGGQQANETAPLGTPRVKSYKPEYIQELRNHYGAERAAQMTGLSVEDVKRLAPGPSRIPLEVQVKELDNPDGIFKYLPR